MHLLNQYFILSALLFSIALAGILVRKNSMITLLMCIELMLLAVNFNFVLFSQYFHALVGQVFVFFILAAAAVESAIGLAILVLIYRTYRSVDLENLSKLKG